jgi:hypothetical protein
MDLSRSRTSIGAVARRLARMRDVGTHLERLKMMCATCATGYSARYTRMTLDGEVSVGGTETRVSRLC